MRIAVGPLVTIDENCYGHLEERKSDLDGPPYPYHPSQVDDRFETNPIYLLYLSV